MTPEPCTPDRFPADRIAFAEELHLRFLEAFGQRLGEHLDRAVKGVPAGIDQMPLTDFLEQSASDACMVRFELAPMRGQAWAGLSRGLVFRVLDILLGSSQSAPAARTTITEIEKHLLHDFFDLLTGTLDAAWKASGVSLTISVIGTAGEVRQAAPADGTALVWNCKLDLGEAAETFRVAIPVLAVRLAALQVERSAAAQVSSETAAQTALLEIVSSARLEVEAVLSGSSIRLGDLASLHPGQILMLNRAAGSPLECLVNGKPKFRGDWIAEGDRHGLQLDTALEGTSGASGNH